MSQTFLLLSFHGTIRESGYMEVDTGFLKNPAVAKRQTAGAFFHVINR
jgi:hypothetical protein